MAETRGRSFKVKCHDGAGNSTVLPHTFGEEGQAQNMADHMESQGMLDGVIAPSGFCEVIPADCTQQPTG